MHDFWVNVRAISVTRIGIALCFGIIGACGGGDEPGTSAVDASGDSAGGDASGADSTTGGDLGPTTCANDTECAGLATGGCADGVCDGGECKIVPRAADAACDDGDPCTSGDRCVAGAGAALTCEPATAACDDGDMCNGTESCAADGCQPGTPLSCGDESVCNGIETCDPKKGCVPAPALPCDDDDDACNGTESCQPTTGCVSAGAPDCDDDNACTTDSCDAATGCRHAIDPTATCCDSNDDCNDQNTCTTETCVTATGKCTVTKLTGASCTTGNACAGAGLCQNGECEAELEADCTPLCTLSGVTGETLECTLLLARTDAADPAAATLAFGATWPASAKLVALVDRRCFVGGSCATVTLPETTTALDPTGHTLFLTPNDPASWTNSLGVEIAHVGSPYAPLSEATVENEAVVGDAEVVTFRFQLTAPTNAGPVRLKGMSATGAGGVILTTALVRGVVLTTADPCGTEVCADLNRCTSDACEDATCTHDAGDGACDDGDACTTTDLCTEGQCAGTAFAGTGTTCPVADACTEQGACDGAGACVVTPALELDCANPGPCLTAACEPATGKCAISPKASATCSDGNACTEDDICSGAGVCAGATAPCDDDVACSLDACEPVLGCTHTPDNSACEDGAACTVASCSLALGGCSHAAVAGSCEDGDPCTILDSCQDGLCEAGDPNPTCGCTTNADCIAKDDGNPCTGVLVCDAGTCALDASTVVVCPPDGYACKTDYACNAASGVCDGVVQVCDDGIGCTADSCDPQEGCKNVAPAGCVTGWICEVSGAAGAVVDCPVRVAAKTGTPAATGMDITLRWDTAKASLTDVLDNACFGPVCFDYSLADCDDDGTNCIWETLSPTGHSSLGVPKSKKDWADKLALLFYHAGSPGTALSPALVGSSNTVSGESTVFVAKFTLKATATAAAPLRINVSDVHLNPSSGLELPNTIQTIGADRLFVTEVK